ncbi:MAG: hypothetical protein GTO62_01945 [Planctomycetales bacterium]|nr:hypothetical protein [Planctomycetales bacterium]NIP67995.1 hypothetical protein [Planctomycetales bacterium]
MRSSSHGQLYPLLNIKWIPGLPLFEWVRDRCREGYSEALTLAAEAWLHVVRELAEHNVVHGDLQHGNVLVDQEGHLKIGGLRWPGRTGMDRLAQSRDWACALPAPRPGRRYGMTRGAR